MAWSGEVRPDDWIRLNDQPTLHLAARIKDLKFPTATGSHPATVEPPRPPVSPPNFTPAGDSKISDGGGIPKQNKSSKPAELPPSSNERIVAEPTPRGVAATPSQAPPRLEPPPSRVQADQTSSPRPDLDAASKTPAAPVRATPSNEATPDPTTTPARDRLKDSPPARSSAPPTPPPPARASTPPPPPSVAATAKQSTPPAPPPATRPPAPPAPSPARGSSGDAVARVETPSPWRKPAKSPEGRLPPPSVDPVLNLPPLPVFDDLLDERDSPTPASRASKETDR